MHANLRDNFHCFASEKINLQGLLQLHLSEIVPWFAQWKVILASRDSEKLPQLLNFNCAWDMCTKDSRQKLLPGLDTCLSDLCQFFWGGKKPIHRSVPFYVTHTAHWNARYVIKNRQHNQRKKKKEDKYLKTVLKICYYPDWAFVKKRNTIREDARNKCHSVSIPIPVWRV